MSAPHEPMEVTGCRRQTRSTCRQESREVSQGKPQGQAHAHWFGVVFNRVYRGRLLLVKSAGGTAAGRTSANFSRASANQFSRIARRRREDKFRCRPMKSQLLASFTLGLCILCFASIAPTRQQPESTLPQREILECASTGAQSTAKESQPADSGLALDTLYSHGENES